MGQCAVVHDLHVAIFNNSHDVNDCLEQALTRYAELAGCLNHLTIFHRIANDKVGVDVVTVDEKQKLLRTKSREINADLLVMFLPKRASWTIVSASHSYEYPETILNSRFSDYLKVMVPAGTSSIFFMAPTKRIADSFTKAMQMAASIVMKTEMPAEDVEMLRSSLQKTR